MQFIFLGRFTQWAGDMRELMPIDEAISPNTDTRHQPRYL